MQARNDSERAFFLSKASDFVVNYGINGVSLVGIFFNIVTITVLATRFFEHKFYNFLQCRCICNLAVCLTGVFFKELANRGEEVEYLPLFLNWFVINIPMRIFFLASVISDNLIILNRLTNLYNKKESIFYGLSKKVSFLTL